MQRFSSAALRGLAGSLAVVAAVSGLTGCQGTLPGAVPEAVFSMAPPSGTAPIAVTFTDMSRGEVVDWLWAFGDGSTSTSPNPVHTYQSTGRYRVRLQISDGASYGVCEQVLNVHLPRTSFSEGTQYGTAAIVSDVNADGAPDIVAVSRTRGEIAWWPTSPATGELGTRSGIESSLQDVALLACGLLDGNAAVDIVVACPLTGVVAAYPSNADGSFAARQNLSTDFAGVSALAIADLDASGAADVVAVSSEADQLVWWSNDGTGSFGSRAVLAEELGGASSLSVHDLDCDGDLDIVVANASDDEIVCLLNDGSGSFPLQRMIQAGWGGANRSLTIDLDGDGDADVVAAASEAGELAWWTNDGVANFSGPNRIAAGLGEIAALAAFDLDDDGAVEILAACRERNQVACFRRYATPALAEVWLEENVDAAVDGAESVCGITLSTGGRCLVGGGGYTVLTLWSP